MPSFLGNTEMRFSHKKIIIGLVGGGHSTGLLEINSGVPQERKFHLQRKTAAAAGHHAWQCMMAGVYETWVSHAKDSRPQSQPGQDWMPCSGHGYMTCVAPQSPTFRRPHTELNALFSSS